MRRASGTTLNEPKGFDVITILREVTMMREVTMNILIIAAMCLAGGLALADESDETQTEGPMEEMLIRLGVMEQIDVTAEKAPVGSSEEFDKEIESILVDAEALEDEGTEE
jgi:hypothetical protein